MSRILTEIWIYPVKSLGGIRLDSSAVMEKGLRYDRRWMLVDENNIFMTQRVFPKMALFKVERRDSGFVVHHGGDSIELSLNVEPLSLVVQTEVWENPVSTLEVGQSFSDWFSDRMGVTCRMVVFPEKNQRPVNPEFAINHEQVSLADGYPLLIIGQASLDDLNTRLKDPVPMNRFRPNLVFTGGVPYEEDQWRNFTVGRNRFAGVKPCSRCVMTTVNQDTGVKGVEPLTTLAGYRKKDEGVYFGQNVLAIDHLEIHEGDRIILD